MRTLAIDLGTRRIGLAISDEGGRFATPHSVIDPTSAIADILNLIHSEFIQRIIIGLPLNMDDSLGPAAQQTIAWSRQLQSQLKRDIPLLFIDERLSSFEAEQQLTQRKKAGEKLTRGKKKKQLDALAAASILQQFLDGKLQPIEVR
jgi:putative Holliday junction resolvase